MEMQNRNNDRNQTRKHLSYYLGVVDRDTNQIVGQVVNMSPSGIGLFGEQPVETGSTMRMTLVLPWTTRGKNQITFDAEAVWCNLDSSLYLADVYDAGFRLSKINEKDREILEQLIDECAVGS